jgi:glycosyltransferase involved in cell wall biosynthesis
MPERHQIAVCVCTYQRPNLLPRLFSALASQHTDGLFEYSVTVVDNDPTESARPVVELFARDASLHVNYAVEPQRGIAQARNKAVESVEADFVAFIDDDEFPGPEWLLTLYKALARLDGQGVLGPVVPHFDEPPPSWVRTGKFYERATHATGTELPWTSTRTGNVLLKAFLFRLDTPPFNPLLRVVARIATSSSG